MEATVSQNTGKRALAAVAHPDDIEFMMAGTLLELRNSGWEIHFWNLANGCCGSMDKSREEIAAIRAKEAAASAALAGAIWHEPLFDDLSVFYDAESLARVASIVREVNPGLILTHCPTDYMEDHQNVCRLVTTAAFSKGMPNFVSSDHSPHAVGPVRIYHALPHGLRDGLGRLVVPDVFVNIGAVLEPKRQLLACHKSQKQWLDTTQGMNAYLEEMTRMCAEMGKMSGQFEYAEGFQRHSHLGFCPVDHDPLGAMVVSAGD
jgi:LmbE family N-acetylglucosaminyl deacetylase